MKKSIIKSRVKEKRNLLPGDIFWNGEHTINQTKKKTKKKKQFQCSGCKENWRKFHSICIWQKGRNWSIGSITSTVEIIPQGGNLSFFLLHPLRSLVSYHQVCMCMCSLKHTQIFINNIIEIAFLHIIKSANLYLTHSHVANIILIQYQPEPKK